MVPTQGSDPGRADIVSTQGSDQGKRACCQPRAVICDLGRAGLVPTQGSDRGGGGIGANRRPCMGTLIPHGSDRGGSPVPRARPGVSLFPQSSVRLGPTAFQVSVRGGPPAPQGSGTGVPPAPTLDPALASCPPGLRGRSTRYWEHKQMLRWFPRHQVTTACFSCSPPDLDFLDSYFIW